MNIIEHGYNFLLVCQKCNIFDLNIYPDTIAIGQHSENVIL